MEVVVEVADEEKINVKEDGDISKLDPDYSASAAIKSSTRNMPSTKKVAMASIRCGTT